MQRATSDELTDWQILESSIDPWGQRREDWRAALIAHAVVRCHAAAGENKIWGASAKTKDFLLDFSPPKPRERQSPAEQLAILKQVADLQNARVAPPGISAIGPRR